MVDESLVRIEEHGKMYLFPVLKCGNTWFYARQSAKGRSDCGADTHKPKQEPSEDRVREMSLF